MNNENDVKDKPADAQELNRAEGVRTPSLGLRTLARAETRVRSGCSKASTSSCGINYRHG